MAARSRSSRTPSACARAPLEIRRRGPLVPPFLVRRGRLFFLPRRGALDHEAEALHGVPGRDLVHAPEDLAAEVGQLVGPHRRGALHGEHAAGEVARARAARHLLAGGARPGGVGARLVARRHAPERRVEDVAQAPGLAAAGAVAFAVARRSQRVLARRRRPGRVGRRLAQPRPQASPESGSSMTVARASSSSVK